MLGRRLAGASTEVLPSADVELSERDAANALIHLYRGELGRMTMYRVRLDTTTNWAVGTTAAITTVAVGSSGIPHYTFALPFVLVLLFSWMEARRYLAYELVRLRVRLLERGLFLRVLGAEAPDGWNVELARSFEHPQPPIGYVQAFAVRLRRSYLWLFFIIYVIWLAKVELVGSLPESASVGGLAGQVVVLLAAVPLLPLVLLSLTHRTREEG